MHSLSVRAHRTCIDEVVVGALKRDVLLDPLIQPRRVFRQEALSGLEEWRDRLGTRVLRLIDPDANDRNIRRASKFLDDRDTARGVFHASPNVGARFLSFQRFQKSLTFAFRSGYSTYRPMRRLGNSLRRQCPQAEGTASCRFRPSTRRQRTAPFYAAWQDIITIAEPGAFKETPS